MFVQFEELLTTIVLSIYHVLLLNISMAGPFQKLEHGRVPSVYLQDRSKVMQEARVYLTSIGEAVPLNAELFLDRLNVDIRAHVKIDGKDYVRVIHLPTDRTFIDYDGTFYVCSHEEKEAFNYLQEKITNTHNDVGYLEELAQRFVGGTASIKDVRHAYTTFPNMDGAQCG